MTSQSQKVVPVILSGGSGTRLWPLSRDSYPKQFIGVVDPKVPLIRETLNRVSDPALFHPPLMIGNDAHRFLLAEQMRQCGFGTSDIMIEPSARNTAPAIAAAALYIQERYGDALMLVLPTDHAVQDTASFRRSVAQAVSVASLGYLVTFGIAPAHPETGYGYIQRGKSLPEVAGAFAISAFVEKPDKEKAKGFIQSGDYLWNSGMFLFPSQVLIEEMQAVQPALLQICRQAVMERAADLGFLRLNAAAFAKAADISIDYALMEKTARAAVVLLDCGWSDTGAWDLLWNLANRDEKGNATFGECYLEDSKDCYVRSERGPAIATLGVDNLVVIATKDVVLVASKEKAQSMKNLATQVRRKNPDLVEANRHVFRPWGMYESIHEGNRFQVKRLTVKPGEKLSIQMHHHRAEHWIVVSGTARMTCDDITKLVTENQSFYVPCGSVHSIENPGKINLDIIEVQSGAYLGEDDIVRFDDRYGRTS